MYYDYSHAVESGLLTAFELFSGLPFLIGIATYVLTALALYTIARRRGLNKPWLAWIPVVNCWILGSLSDQYRYVVHGENKSKRKVLLTLSIILSALSMAMVVVFGVIVIHAIGSAFYGVGEQELLGQILGLAFSLLGLCLPLAGVAIAYAIIRYMALYDVYKSMDPSNCVLFLVLSILLSVTEPFFLFFSRNKDDGMPPRRTEPPRIPQQEPWESENKDYL